MGLTKEVLKRPVTTVLGVVLFFVNSRCQLDLFIPAELIPEMEMPMLVISAGLPERARMTWAAVISKIEDEIGTLSGVDSVTSMSSENFGIVLVQYDYDQISIKPTMT